MNERAFPDRHAEDLYNLNNKTFQRRSFMQGSDFKYLDSTLLNDLAQKAHQGKFTDIDNYNALIVFASTYKKIQNNGEVVDAKNLISFKIHSFTFEINNGSKFHRDFIYVQEVFSDKEKQVTILKILNISFEDCNPPSDEFSSNQSFWHPVIPNNDESYLFIKNDLFFECFKPINDFCSDESYDYGKSNFINYYEEYLKKDIFDYSCIP